jgi:flagellin
MAIGVQNTSSALLALQTLNRLNDASQSGQADAAEPAAEASAASPSVLPAAGAQALSADSLGAVTASLDRASSITDAALSTGQSISDLLSQMKALVSAGDGGATSGADANNGLSSLLSQVSAAVSGAGFDGVNLLDGSAGASVTVGAGTSGALTLATQNLSLGGSVITVSANADVSTQTAAASVLNDINTSIANLDGALGQIGVQARQIQAHASFVSRLSDVLAQGANAATAPPTSADGARLMALQVQQQLASQGGAIASANPQVLLSLFK